MSITPPVANKKRSTVLVVIVSVVISIIVASGLGTVVYLVTTAEVRAELKMLELDPLIADDITGLQETRLSFSEGGESLGKPTYTKAFRSFRIYDDLPTEDVASTIREKAKAAGWAFEREAHSQDGSFRMSKHYDYEGTNKEIVLFVHFSSPTEVGMTFTVY